MDVSQFSKASMDSQKKIRKRTYSKNRSYEVEDLSSAVEAIKKGELSIRRAACQYNIPKSTLRSRIMDHVPVGATLGGCAPTLSSNLEQDLVCWLHARDEMGARVGWHELASAVEKLSSNLNMTKSTSSLPSKKFHKSSPSSGWLVRFRKRHQNVPILRTKKEDWYPPSRFSTSIMQHWMQKLDKRLQASAHSSALRLFSNDKKNCVFNLGLLTFSQDSLHISVSLDLNCKNSFAQLVLCFSAHCIIKPVLVVKEDMIPHWHKCSGQNKFPFDVIASEELFNRDVFIAIIEKMVTTKHEKAAAGPTLLLFDRSLACIDVEVSKIAQENNILLQCFPLHSIEKQPHYSGLLGKMLSLGRKLDACNSEESKLHFISSLWWQEQEIDENWASASFESCGLLPLSKIYKDALKDNGTCPSTSSAHGSNTEINADVIRGMRMALNVIESRCVDPQYLSMYKDFFVRNESPKNDPTYSAWKELKLEISKLSTSISATRKNSQQRSLPDEKKLVDCSVVTNMKSDMPVTPLDATAKMKEKPGQVMGDQCRSNTVSNSSCELRDSVPISDRYKREFNFDSMPALNLEQHALEIMEQYQAMAGSGQLQQLVIDADTDFGADPSLQ